MLMGKKIKDMPTGEKEMKKKPTVHTNDTGGTWIDVKELFTTEQGRKAIEKMIGSPSTAPSKPC